MSDEIKKAAEIVTSADFVISLTGAGISVESGIPDFRSPGGLWEEFDPFVYASIDTFNRNPEKVWEMLFAMINVKLNAHPNPGHRALARLEELGFLQYIITQNIDNLHQEAGSKNVVEFHGNASRLECLECGREYDLAAIDLSNKIPPRCGECDMILKPTVIFFGETIPFDAMRKSQELAEKADALIVVGTSAVVYPAAGIPLVAKRRGAKIVEFNVTPTDFTRSITDVFIRGKAGEMLPKLVEYVSG